MPEPMWRKIVNELQVPEAGQQWKLALNYVTPGKLMKVEVVVNTARNPPVTGTWTPQGFATACTADGDFNVTAQGPASPAGTRLVASAPLGALIARIGGSTADQTLDTSATPARVVFSIGRSCVFTVPASPTGSLYLGANDDPTRMAAVNGTLLVNIFEAI